MFESLNENNFEKVKLPFSTDNFEFKKLKELDPNQEYHIFGFFVTKSKKKNFGDTLVLITDKFYINLPTRYSTKFTNEEKSAFWSGKYSLCDIKPLHTDAGDTMIFNMKETHPDYIAPTEGETPEIPFN